jgi:hypothetical protein
MIRLVIILLLIQGGLYAQYPVWPQPGAEWEICHGQFWEGDSYSITPSIRYEKDTIINNTEYQITSRQTANGQIMIEFYTRFSQDTIFRYVNGNEYLFFTYNVAVGDTLFPLRSGVEDYNEDTFSYTLELLCLNISPITIDGNLLNIYKFMDVGNSIYGTNGQNPIGESYFYWIEIIGWVSSFPWLIEPSEWSCNDIIFDGGLEFPIYYTDSTRSWPIDFQANGLVCDTLLIVEELLTNSKIDLFTIHPNPTSGNTVFTIELDDMDGLSLIITDLNGRVVKIFEVSNKEMVQQLEFQTNGVYLVHLTSKEKILSTKKLIYAK